MSLENWTFHDNMVYAGIKGIMAYAGIKGIMAYAGIKVNMAYAGIKSQHGMCWHKKSTWHTLA